MGLGRQSPNVTSIMECREDNGFINPFHSSGCKSPRFANSSFCHHQFCHCLCFNTVNVGFPVKFVLEVQSQVSGIFRERDGLVING